MTSTADQATLLRAVAFDLDGTLIDSAPDIAHALNEALHEAGLARVDLAQVHAWIGDGPDVLITRALQALGQPATPALQQSLRQHFDRVTLQQPLAHGALFDGVAALLQQLRAQRPLVVVTNKPSRLARAVLDAAGVLSHFAAVHGADTAAWRKPAPVLLQRAAAELGLPASALAMDLPRSMTLDSSVPITSSAIPPRSSMRFRRPFRSRTPISSPSASARPARKPAMAISSRATRFPTASIGSRVSAKSPSLRSQTSI